MAVRARLQTELNRAHAEGLVDYRGTRDAAGRTVYEVHVAGHLALLDEAEVLPTLARVRAVAGAVERGLLDRLVFTDGDVYVVTFSAGGRPHEVNLPGRTLQAWLAGFTAAGRAAGIAPARAGDVAGLRALLDDPDLGDQIRLELHGEMEAAGVTVSELARRSGHTDKTVAGALRFGRFIDTGIADRLMRALDRRWRVASAPALWRGAPSPVRPQAMHAGNEARTRAVRRMLVLLAVADMGWLAILAPTDPDAALGPAVNPRRPQTLYELAVGDTTYAVVESDLTAWMDGLTAWHAHHRLAHDHDGSELPGSEC